MTLPRKRILDLRRIHILHVNVLQKRRIMPHVAAMCGMMRRWKLPARRTICKYYANDIQLTIVADEAAVALVARYFCLLEYENNQRRRYRQRRRRRLWVHEVIKERDKLGEYERLVQELRLHGQRFRRYFRMTSGQFDHLLWLNNVASWHTSTCCMMRDDVTCCVVNATEIKPLLISVLRDPRQRGVWLLTAFYTCLITMATHINARWRALCERVFTVESKSSRHHRCCQSEWLDGQHLFSQWL